MQAYRNGYADGCDSGQCEAGNPWMQFRRDWAVYPSDAQYKQGWDEGHAACFASYNVK